MHDVATGLSPLVVVPNSGLHLNDLKDVLQVMLGGELRLSQVFEIHLKFPSQSSQDFLCSAEHRDIRLLIPSPNGSHPLASVRPSGPRRRIRKLALVSAAASMGKNQHFPSFQSKELQGPNHDHLERLHDLSSEREATPKLHHSQVFQEARKPVIREEHHLVLDELLEVHKVPNLVAGAEPKLRVQAEDLWQERLREVTNRVPEEEQGLRVQEEVLLREARRKTLLEVAPASIGRSNI